MFQIKRKNMLTENFLMLQQVYEIIQTTRNFTIATCFFHIRNTVPQREFLIWTIFYIIRRWSHK